MSPILLNTQVQIYLLGEGILYIFMLIAFGISIDILLRWNFESFSDAQYRLEKKSYLVITILSFIFVIKFLLLPYFVFTIDSLNSLVKGAMCGAGVISANSYGLELLFIKLLVIFTLTLWLMINYYDLEAKNYPYFKIKYGLYIAIFLLVTYELWLDFNYFININTNQVVSCCSALFGQLEGANPLPFGLDTKMMLILFYSIFITLVILIMSNQDILALIFTALFLYISYYAIIYFFGTYIYELPTHKCPFCMFQKEYYYIGYFVWGSLFTGAFLVSDAIICKEVLRVDTSKSKIYGLYFLVIFVTIVTMVVLLYRFKNGAWL